MKHLNISLFLILLSLSGNAAGQTTSSPSTDPIKLPVAIAKIVESNCLDCHQGEEAEANVRLDNFSTLTAQLKIELLNRIQDQVFFELMPPQDAGPLKVTERSELSNWLSSELKKRNASKLETKLKKPGYGNFVDHDDLFSGKYKHLGGFTYDRRWLISEFIFDAKFNRILNHKPNKTIDGKRQWVIGSNNRRVNLTNPFLLPTNTGVRYYANTTLNGGHLLTMITNAKEASAHMVYLTRRDKRYLPAVANIMKQEWDHEKVLASRQSFLDRFIDRILKDIYKDQHASMLPKFVAQPSPEIPTTTESGKPIKKAPFHAANPGAQELVLIFRSMRKLKTENETDEELIQKCEKEWFFYGHNPRKIQARVTFLKNYMEQWRTQIVQHRYEQKHKPHVYRALADSEMKSIHDAILKHRKQGDHYDEIIQKCMAEFEKDFQRERIEAGSPGQKPIAELVSQFYEKILERAPTELESEKYVALGRGYFESLGNLGAVEKLIQTLILNSDFVYRREFGSGSVDDLGRQLLNPRDGAYAIAYALTDSSPDQQLRDAVQNGKLNSREDYEREVRRLLKKRDQFYVIDEAVERIQLTASITNTPIRKLRFFREFFGYPRMLPIFKDNKRFGGNYDNAKGRLVGEADRLVDHILSLDKNVIEQLLTTENFYVYHSGDNDAMTASSERIREIYEYFKDLDWEDFEAKDLLKHKDFLEKVKMRGVDVKRLVEKGRRNSIREFKTAMTSFTLRFDKGQTAAAPFVSFPAHGLYNASTRTGLQLRSPEVAKFFNIRLDNWNYPSVQPAKVSHRKGMLTHPAWLIAHAQNTETDPVIRGKFVREKLLAGTVPDLPITVDAVIPEDHHKTMRQRLEKTTGQRYCWKCHQKMDPLGLPFEMFDDFGRFRTQESLEHPNNLIKKGPDKAANHVDLRDTYKTLPVDPNGFLRGSGDEKLDGAVADAFDLMDRLARSDRVRQSIIRYAFRYFMGRNEMLSDSKTLIDADQAYLKSDGSFDAVIVSLLTSDSFIYRKPAK